MQTNRVPTLIEPMPGWKEGCQIRVLTDRYHQLISSPNCGEGIVEGCTRLQSRHDFWDDKRRLGVVAVHS
jgi:hypothetical protein